MAPAKKLKTRRRYSIGEWYGVGIETITPKQWFDLAKKEIEVDALTGTPCPFQADDAIYNKKGGVCSLRLYEQIGDGPVTGTKRWQSRLLVNLSSNDGPDCRKGV